MEAKSECDVDAEGTADMIGLLGAGGEEMEREKGSDGD